MLYVCMFSAQQPPVGHGLLIHEVSRSHSTTHHIRQDSSGRVISSSQRPLPDKTQHSQQTYIHAPGGIRTHNLSRRAAANARLKPRAHWDRRYDDHSTWNYKVVQTERYAACTTILLTFQSASHTVECQMPQDSNPQDHRTANLRQTKI